MTSKNCLSLALLALCGLKAVAVDVASTTLAVTLDEQAQGAVARLVSARGQELGPDKGRTALFGLSLCRTDCYTNMAYASASDATSFTVERLADGVRLVYGFADGAVEKVVCTVRAPAGDGKVRWRIRTTARTGWSVTETRYPRIPLAPQLGTTGSDDACVLGLAKGGVLRNPGANRVGWSVSGREPGNLVAQFACLYDDRGGFYLAAEDAEGHAKHLSVERTADALVFAVRCIGFAQDDAQPYDVATAAFEGKDGSLTDWHDAADIYKAWALGQPWCATPLARRPDLPVWMKDAPAMVRFGRDWLENPNDIRAWMKDYWQKEFPAAPLVMAYWGWEKRGYWVTPDYYPVHPDDATFEKLVREMRTLGGHAFPWPSGYHWTLLYTKNPDGSFVWDDRARFDSYARPHAIHNRDGQLYIRTPSWLRGGNCSCMCGGDPWTIRWWNDEVCLPLVKLGCEMIQVDQVVGGAFPPCWAKNHPHPPGEGKWKTDCFREQLVTMAATMKAVEPDSIVCFEEPNEHFNHLVGIQDYRDCEIKHEWASVFNYLYHEFVPCFQSNPRRGNRVWQAHEAADGQIPHLTPSRRDLSCNLSAVANGDFENAQTNDAGFLGWDRLNGYNGAVWSGRWFVDRAEKKDGAASLRLETGPKETVQVSQNVQTDDATAFRVGAKYRLSAWMKTGKMVRSNTIRFGVFAPGLKGLAGGGLPFPKAGEGWRRVSKDFTLPAGSEMIRIMIHIDGEATAWVDGVTLEAVAEDGTAKPLVLSERTAYDAFMKNWVALYHGKGRDWLAFGRQIKPPRLIGATQDYDGRTVPCVFHAAYESLDGRKAVVLANATAMPQDVTLVSKVRRLSLTLAPDEIRLLTTW